jgi:hypothetical protein
LVDAGLGIHRPILSAASAWIGREYHAGWSFVAALEHGVGLHHGGIPRALSQLNISLFNEGILPFLVCTSTLIEGVNTAAKNVIVYENKIATTKLDFFTFNNIKGRSGRMFQHFLGNVFIFDQEPQEELDFVDIPAFTQGENAPLGLLVHLETEDLTPRSLQRLEVISGQRELSLFTIRRNSPLDPVDQIRLAADIRKNARRWHNRLNWTGYPEREQLVFACTLIYDYFVKRRRGGIASGKQLAFRLSRLRNSRTIREFIGDILQNDTQANGNPNEAVRIALDFQRKWAMFTFPRLLIALEAIQREVFSTLGLPPGRFGRYAADVESVFLPPELVGLDEYGLPIQLGLKLRSHLQLGQGMDLAIDSVRTLQPERLSLTQFERFMLERVQGGL